MGCSIAGRRSSIRSASTERARVRSWPRLRAGPLPAGERDQQCRFVRRVAERAEDLVAGAAPARVDRGADEHHRADPLRSPHRQLGDDLAAHRVGDERRPLQPDRVQPAPERIGETADPERRVRRLALSVTREVGRERRAAGGEDARERKHVAARDAVSVHEHHRRPLAPDVRMHLRRRPPRPSGSPAWARLEGCAHGSTCLGVVDHRGAGHEVLQGAAAAVDQGGEEAGEQEDDREGNADQTEERTPAGRRVARRGDDAHAHQTHAGRLADRAPEPDEVADDHERPARLRRAHPPATPAAGPRTARRRDRSAPRRPRRRRPR